MQSTKKINDLFCAKSGTFFIAVIMITILQDLYDGLTMLRRKWLLGLVIMDTYLLNLEI